MDRCMNTGRKEAERRWGGKKEEGRDEPSWGFRELGIYLQTCIESSEAFFNVTDINKGYYLSK